MATTGKPGRQFPGLKDHRELRDRTLRSFLGWTGTMGKLDRRSPGLKESPVSQALRSPALTETTEKSVLPSLALRVRKGRLGRTHRSFPARAVTMGTKVLISLVHRELPEPPGSRFREWTATMERSARRCPVHRAPVEPQVRMPPSSPARMETMVSRDHRSKVPRESRALQAPREPETTVKTARLVRPLRDLRGRKEPPVRMRRSFLETMETMVRRGR
jgi:hypothetical protein